MNVSAGERRKSQPSPAARPFVPMPFTLVKPQLGSVLGIQDGLRAGPAPVGPGAKAAPPPSWAPGTVGKLLAQLSHCS